MPFSYLNVQIATEDLAMEPGSIVILKLMEPGSVVISKLMEPGSVVILKLGKGARFRIYL